MPDQYRQIDPAQPFAGSRCRSLAIWIWSSLLIADAVLVTRRIAGEFATPLPPLLAVSTTAVIAAASWAAWYFFKTSQERVDAEILRAEPRALAPRRRADWLQPTALTLISPGISVAATLVWSWSISSGATAVTCGCLVAIQLLHASAVSSWDLIAGRISIPDRRVPAGAISETGISLGPIEGSELPRPRVQSPSESSFVADVFDCEPDREESEVEADENQTLWLSRRLTDEGETIEGWVRVPFAAGQRETIVHVAFCPPLAGTPEIETEDLEGVGLEIRVAAVFPFGARLSVRRSGPLVVSHNGRIGFTANGLTSIRAA